MILSCKTLGIELDKEKLMSSISLRVGRYNHNSVVIGLACNSFHPFGHIVHSNEDVQIAKGVWERSHEINAPHI
jgi:hypothetical protein